MTSWRPEEGWDSESVVIAVYQELTTESTDEKERKLVEAGADAMLKALKHKAWRRKENGTIIPSDKSLINAPSGYLVFIPDDEEENK